MLLSPWCGKMNSRDGGVHQSLMKDRLVCLAFVLTGAIAGKLKACRGIVNLALPVIGRVSWPSRVGVFELAAGKLAALQSKPHAVSCNIIQCNALR